MILGTAIRSASLYLPDQLTTRAAAALSWKVQAAHREVSSSSCLGWTDLFRAPTGKDELDLALAVVRNGLLDDLCEFGPLPCASDWDAIDNLPTFLVLRLCRQEPITLDSAYVRGYDFPELRCPDIERAKLKQERRRQRLSFVAPDR